MKLITIISWALRLVTAVILLQTLYFKFTGQPESVELFTKLGVEPWGRIGTGVFELIASILLLVPATVFFGALMGAGIMSGAILSHVAVLGIESQGDGGQLFMLAIIVMICSASLLLIHKQTALDLYSKFFQKNT